VPPAYPIGDKPLYLKAVANSKEAYSRDGIVSPQGMTSILDMLKTLDPELQNANIDVSKTCVDRFGKRATA
jgi:NitT/TauT family transport system substrate-binding protein